MSTHLASLWLFPVAFAVLICSKLYGVTRGTLVPEMARTDQLREHTGTVSNSGWPTTETPDDPGFSGFNAQLTLLGTLAGLIGGALGAGILKSLGAPSVLVLAAVVFAVGVVAALRLHRPSRRIRDQVSGLTLEERDLQRLNPAGDPAVTWGLGASALMRFAVGFATFLLAFELRRLHASLGWFGVALACSAVGSLLGLGTVTRVRTRLRESTLLTISLLLTGIAAGVVSRHATLIDQAALAGVVGLGASIAQPSFDALTQRLVPPGAQGRTFARFAVRQQLTWVLGALIPVAISLNFADGDQFLALVLIAGGLYYLIARPRSTRRSGDEL